MEIEAAAPSSDCEVCGLHESHFRQQFIVTFNSDIALNIALKYVFRLPKEHEVIVNLQA